VVTCATRIDSSNPSAGTADLSTGTMSIESIDSSTETPHSTENRGVLDEISVTPQSHDLSTETSDSHDRCNETPGRSLAP
jgi:hypothetical protein